MLPYIDLHTHHFRQEEGVISVCNLMLHEKAKIPTAYFSAGLHPWYADRLSSEDLRQRLDQLAQPENFVAFGETGLDKVCKVPMQLQMDVFECHLKKAVEYRKPIILHCVKAWDELIEIAAKYHVIKILHGYNGSIQQTEQFIKSGFLFSVGKGILHPASKIRSAIGIIPLSSLYCETDDTDVTIQSIYQEVSSVIKMKEEDLKSTIYSNYIKIRQGLASDSKKMWLSQK